MKSEANIFTALLMLFLIGCSKEAEEDIPVVITPSSATLIFPENNSECNEGKVISDTESIVNFRWEASQNTDRYLLNVKLVEDGSIQTITSSSLEADVTILRGKTYQWHVISKKDGVSITAESPVWSFYNAGIASENNIPLQAELVYPLSGSTVSPCSVNLEWSSSDVDDELLTYEILLGDSYPPTNLIGSTSDNTYSTSIDGRKTYYWQIITIDQSGSKSYSNIFSFSVEPLTGNCSDDSSSNSGNLVKDSEMNDTGFWNYRQLWTESDNAVNHGFVSGEYAFRSAQGVTYSNAIIWQEIEVEADTSYKFDLYLRSNGTSNSWFEVYFGSIPIEGGNADDYTSNGAQIYVKSFGENENCGVNSFEGSIFDIITDGCPIPSESLFDSSGNLTFPTSYLTSEGTIYLGIKAGNYNGNFGSGIFVDDVILFKN